MCSLHAMLNCHKDKNEERKKKNQNGEEGGGRREERRRPFKHHVVGCDARKTERILTLPSFVQ